MDYATISATISWDYTSTFYLQVHRACITSTTGCYSTTICGPPRSSSSMASTGKTRDIQCRKCLGFGHIEKECRTKRVMLVREDGEYDSASDFDEDTLALIAARDGANSDSEREMEVMEADTADQYRSLVAQRVLSVQLSKAEHDQRHNLFQTRGVVKERAIRIIIDGGSCNNLASVDMVEKLSLPTRQRTHPYYIQWFESSRKLKCFRSGQWGSQAAKVHKLEAYDGVIRLARAHLGLSATLLRANMPLLRPFFSFVLATTGDTVPSGASPATELLERMRSRDLMCGPEGLD
ncbi:hypothetical protein QYE76_002638 [Lolium multiflorum]|uniref:Gag-pol polyprotein n=1 Tax=Lolium multiflorum TaxID=4521 RepID=A0AAD8W0H7_LOLMU|nr:hypothetical protein QYE76_002638 [Lolium multiflorum]